MPAFHVVALISGGKDSFFSILHCRAHGHTVVALANLHPRAQDAEDLDSFMYQTVGHAVIPLYAQALALPLYRQEIRGSATVQERDYHYNTNDDETESLVPLLRRVMAARPEVNAVSTGAILSDYQRTRVESVALRLGLTPLSYLWQWPSLPPQTQTSLLEDMAAVGQDSRIVKVASGGMDESFLWQNVADAGTISRLNTAAQRFGTCGDGAVLGEGGEFETLAISGPAPLWKGRIEVAPEDVKIVPGEAGSASVQLTNASVVCKNDGQNPPMAESALRVPALLEARFREMLEGLQAGHSLEPDGAIRAFSQAPDLQDRSHTGVDILANLTGNGETAAAQTKTIMDHAVATLAAMGHSIHHVANAVIVLRDMDDFAAVNPVYGSYFTKPNPPARITIACADVLPSDALLTISIAVAPGKREGLHVQSRSYWAPANIGPYSQSIRQSSLAEAGDHIYVAGQIPLIPATMQLPDEQSNEGDAGFALQSVLALQHLDRIGRVMKVRQWTFGIAFIASAGVAQSTVSNRASIARLAWKQYHTPSSSSSPSISASHSEDDEEFDVWHQQRGSGRDAWQSHMQSSVTESAVDTVPDRIPCMAVVTADALPRGAAIEWVGFGNSTSTHEDIVPAHLATLLRAFQHRILPV